jgi:hypothetical protein
MILVTAVECFAATGYQTAKFAAAECYCGASEWRGSNSEQSCELHGLALVPEMLQHCGERYIMTRTMITTVPNESRGLPFLISRQETRIALFPSLILIHSPSNDNLVSTSWECPESKVCIDSQPEFFESSRAISRKVNAMPCKIH